MTSVPSNLIPTRLTQLPTSPTASEDGWLMYVYQGNSYKIRAGDLLAVAGVPVTRQVIAGTGLTGGGTLESNVTLSVAVGGIGTTQLADTGVTAGVYGSSSQVPVLTIDAKGRISAATTAALTISGYVPESRQVIAGTGLTGGGALNANVTLNANLSDSTPLSLLSSGSAGVSNTIARYDHQHPAVDLSSSTQRTGILGLANGGTARSITPVNGGIVWSGSDGLYVGPAGTSGQVLVSNGLGEYEWGSALIVTDQPANYIYASPASGGSGPTTFRLMVNSDLPDSGVTASTYGSATQSAAIVVNSKGVITGISVNTITPAFSNITGKPTTLSGYGITDGAHNGANSDITSLSGLTTPLTVAQGGTGVNTLTGYVKGAGSSNLTASTTIPTSDLSGTISNVQLANSSITINGNSVSLGGSTTITATATNVLTIGTGLSGTSYNGSAAVTIAIDSTVVTLTGSQVLTNKTLTLPVIAQISNSGVLTLPTSTDTLVGRATTDTLTNKTISGANNTLSNIGNASLTNSSVTIGLTSVSLGGTALTLTGLTSVAVTQDPTLALQLTTKQYVDNRAAAGIDVHTAVAGDVDTNKSATYTDGGTTPVWTTITSNEVFTGSAHGLSVNDMIVFGNTTNGLIAGTAYFVYSVPSITSVTLSASYGGSQIDTLTNGSGLTITSRANSGVGATLTSTTNGQLSYEGYSFVLGDRVLFGGQTSGAQNGVYTITQQGDGSTPWIATRATDANKYIPNSSLGLDQGAYFLVSNGSDAGEAYVCNNVGNIIIGTTSITFGDFSRPPVYTAGTGLTLNTFQFSITPVGTAGTYGSASVVPVITTNASGQVSSVSNTSIAIAASQVTSGTLAVANGGTNIASYTIGDLLYASGGTALSKLGLGTSGYVLTAGVSAPQYTAQSSLSVGTATNLAGGAASQIPYQSGSGATTFLANGTAGQVLTSAGASAPTWSGINGGTF